MCNCSNCNSQYLHNFDDNLEVDNELVENVSGICSNIIKAKEMKFFESHSLLENRWFD